MNPLVRLSLSLLRLAAHTSFFLEAQRLLLRLVRPTGTQRLVQLEDNLLDTICARVQHRWIPDANGNVIHVLEIDDGHDRRPEDRVAVLLHGHSMSAAYWFRNADDLVSRGYRVFAVDLLGWGRSARPRFRGASPNDAVLWYTVSLTHVLRTALRLRAFVLIGHSLGAYLSLELARQGALHISRCVLVAPAASTAWCSWSRALFFKLSPQRILRRGGLMAYLLFLAMYPRAAPYTQLELRDYTFHLARQAHVSGRGGDLAVSPMIQLQCVSPLRWRPVCARPLVDQLDKLDGQHTDRRGQVKHRGQVKPTGLPGSKPLKQIPILIVCGDSDSSMPVETVLQLASRMRRSNHDVTLKIIEGCDHCPQLEKPKQFFDSIHTFL